MRKSKLSLCIWIKISIQKFHGAALSSSEHFWGKRWEFILFCCCYLCVFSIESHCVALDGFELLIRVVLNLQSSVFLLLGKCCHCFLPKNLQKVFQEERWNRVTAIVSSQEWESPDLTDETTRVGLWVRSRFPSRAGNRMLGARACATCRGEHAHNPIPSPGNTNNCELLRKEQSASRGSGESVQLISSWRDGNGIRCWVFNRQYG